MKNEVSFFDVIIIVYLVLLGVYIITHYKLLPQIDIVLCIVAIIALMLTWCKAKQQPVIEKYTPANGASSSSTGSTGSTSSTSSSTQASTTTQIDPSTFSGIRTEEDISELSSQCKLYVTAFNNRSYNGSGKSWKNVSSIPITEEDKCPQGSRDELLFDNVPTYSRGAGFSMSSNRIKGPLCNNLGIRLSDPFTVFISFKNQTFVQNPNEEVILFNMYGNSGNNNAVSLLINKSTINISNGVQSGDLVLQWTDSPVSELIHCKLNPTDTNFVFNKDDITTLFIVRNTDEIKVLYMYGQQSSIQQIAQKSLTVTGATFANKELVINREFNWKANMYGFGIIDSAISDSAAISIHTHLYTEYIKATSTAFSELTNTYNRMYEYIQGINRCPYDSATCAKCSTITNWSSPTVYLTAPSTCKKAINDYCKNNPENALCSCWDINTTSTYNSAACRGFRNVFDDASSCLNELSQTDITFLRERHKLISEEDCPVPPPPPPCNCSAVNTMTSNVYADLDYNQMVIDPSSLRVARANRLQVTSPYMEDPSVLTLQDRPTSSNLMEYTSSNVRVGNGGISVTEAYKIDPQTNYDQNRNEGVSAYMISTSKQNTGMLGGLFDIFLPRRS
jgi:hypothetical protein